MQTLIATKTSALVSLLLMCLTAVAIMTLPAQAHFPDRRIRIIVPFTPGGGADIVARLLAEYMSKDLGKPVIIGLKQTRRFLEPSSEQRKPPVVPPTVIRC